jgi:hypothetical protein
MSQRRTSATDEGDPRKLVSAAPLWVHPGGQSCKSAVASGPYETATAPAAMASAPRPADPSPGIVRRSPSGPTLPILGAPYSSAARESFAMDNAPRHRGWLSRPAKSRLRQLSKGTPITGWREDTGARSRPRRRRRESRSGARLLAIP